MYQVDYGSRENPKQRIFKTFILMDSFIKNDKECRSVNKITQLRGFIPYNILG